MWNRLNNETRKKKEDRKVEDIEEKKKRGRGNIDIYIYKRKKKERKKEASWKFFFCFENCLTD